MSVSGERPRSEQDMETHSIPQISASLSVDPAMHSFANSQAPNLNLTLTSHYPDPITIYADDVSPTLMLTCGALTITDVSTGSSSEVRQSTQTHCRIPPPSKVAVPLNADLFHTLLPHTPLTLSAPFTRSRKSTGGNKALAKHDPDYASDRSATHGACGVDGLEPGHRYVLSLAGTPRVRWDIIRWWEYGSKEEVLRADGAGGSLDGRRVKFGAGRHEPIVVDSARIGVAEFECCE